jgi:hypothetical protein
MGEATALKFGLVVWRQQSQAPKAFLRCPGLLAEMSAVQCYVPWDLPMEEDRKKTGCHDFECHFKHDLPAGSSKSTDAENDP